jgi:hypothetical protein
MSALVAKLQAQREARVEVAPGKYLVIRRPLAAHMHRLRHGVTPDLLCESVVGWDGFKEADLLPAGVGGDMAAEFSPEAVREAVLDRQDWIEAASGKLVEMVERYFADREATAKN